MCSFMVTCKKSYIWYSRPDLILLVQTKFVDTKVSLWLKLGESIMVCKTLTRSSCAWLFQSQADNSLFVKKDGAFIIVLLVYVNGLTLADNRLDKIIAVKSYLHDKFKIKDLDTLKFFSWFWGCKNILRRLF